MTLQLAAPSSCALILILDWWQNDVTDGHQMSTDVRCQHQQILHTERAPSVIRHDTGNPYKGVEGKIINGGFHSGPCEGRLAQRAIRAWAAGVHIQNLIGGLELFLFPIYWE